MNLPTTAYDALSDLDVTAKIIRRLQRPLTNANWEQEARLLARQVKRTRESLLTLEKALAPPKPA